MIRELRRETGGDRSHVGAVTLAVPDGAGFIMATHPGNRSKIFWRPATGFWKDWRRMPHRSGRGGKAAVG